LIQKLELLKEYTGPYGIETPEKAIDLCIARVKEYHAQGEIPVISEDEIITILHAAMYPCSGLHVLSSATIQKIKKAAKAIRPYLREPKREIVSPAPVGMTAKMQKLVNNGLIEHPAFDKSDGIEDGGTNE